MRSERSKNARVPLCAAVQGRISRVAVASKVSEQGCAAFAHLRFPVVARRQAWRSGSKPFVRVGLEVALNGTSSGQLPRQTAVLGTSEAGRLQQVCYTISLPRTATFKTTGPSNPSKNDCARCYGADKACRARNSALSAAYRGGGWAGLVLSR